MTLNKAVVPSTMLVLAFSVGKSGSICHFQFSPYIWESGQVTAPESSWKRVKRNCSTKVQNEDCEVQNDNRGMMAQGSSRLFLMSNLK